ncbi:PREDICTED: limbic system-associated membrane protein-like, partial [Nanorana parkeri]|uniref:limbic system-associated membrane protein-like n=1 Tax=Nanorana parkeri TaxID=125878 RepID=UPI0008549E3B
YLYRYLSTAREFEGEEEYLDIQGITREQSGKYECKAANEVASADVKQVRVTVNYPPVITESKSIEAFAGKQAYLRCEASAEPKADFEWYKDDTRLSSAQGLEIKNMGNRSTLTVANVTEEHYGNYTCVAANKLGITNTSLYLYKRAIPTKPIPASERGNNAHFKLKDMVSVASLGLLWMGGAVSNCGTEEICSYCTERIDPESDEWDSGETPSIKFNRRSSALSILMSCDMQRASTAIWTRPRQIMETGQPAGGGGGTERAEND